MIDWSKVRLLGIDVGYSKSNDTTGIAIYENGRLKAPRCVGSSAEARASIISSDLKFDAVAIDGPVVPEKALPTVRQLAEFLLIGQGFYNRCKPGLSHFGRELELREAANIVADQMTFYAKGIPKHLKHSAVRKDASIVEAFPNAFLGVMLDDAEYNQMGQVDRGKKFDRLYERAISSGKIVRLFDEIKWPAPDVLATMVHESTLRGRATHEKRAALVCLLTAACAHAGQFEMVGDIKGGYIFLPPQALWQPWAVTALADRKKVMQNHRHFMTGL